MYKNANETKFSRSPPETQFLCLSFCFFLFYGFLRNILIDGECRLPVSFKFGGFVTSGGCKVSRVCECMDEFASEGVERRQDRIS